MFASSCVCVFLLLCILSLIKIFVYKKNEIEKSLEEKKQEKWSGRKSVGVSGARKTEIGEQDERKFGTRTNKKTQVKTSNENERRETLDEFHMS